jgi:hypothetical protein
MARKLAQLKTAKSLLNKLNTLDANFLLGKIQRKRYLVKRAALRRQFEALKRRIR